jgi:uncharacterized membrane protein
MLMSFLKKSRINGLFSLAQFNRFTLLMLILLILAGAGLRFYSLGGKSMWDDEVITVEISAKDFTHIWQDLSWRQNSPPLHYLLVHFFLYFGLNEFWARFPSAVSQHLIVDISTTAQSILASSLKDVLGALEASSGEAAP